jgi:hypothetical protein
MEFYPWAYLVECQIGGRPLYLPTLYEPDRILLPGCGTRPHAKKDIPDHLRCLNLSSQWLIVTRPDGEHSGGAPEIRVHPEGVTLRELCEQVSDKGTWQRSLHLDWANTLSGHLNRGVDLGLFNVDSELFPTLWFSEVKYELNWLLDLQTTLERN